MDTYKVIDNYGFLDKRTQAKTEEKRRGKAKFQGHEELNIDSEKRGRWGASKWFWGSDYDLLLSCTASRDSTKGEQGRRSSGWDVCPPHPLQPEHISLYSFMCFIFWSPPKVSFRKRFPKIKEGEKQKVEEEKKEREK